MAVHSEYVRQFRSREKKNANAQGSGPEGDRMSAVAPRKGSTPVEDVLETDEAKGLLETGREAGSLSTEEIALALGALDLDAGQMDDFYAALEELQIEVVDGAEPEEELDLKAEAREVSTDALQLFLKDVGRVELLTAAQEVELAKR